MSETTAREAIADLVRREAASRRVSQTGVALLAGISKQSASQKMNGRVAFSFEEIGLLAEAWSVPVTAFLPPEGFVRRQGLEPRTR